MDENTRKELERESNLFCGEAIGKTAVAKGTASYVVTGTYMDANGCMKTHDSGHNSSFIDSTEYH